MFIDNFERICKIKGLKPTPTLNECGISPATATNWTKKRTVIPDGKTIVKLAEYLGVSTDYLLLGKEASLTPEEQRLVTNFSALNSDNQIRVLERIETLLETQVTERELEDKMIYIKHSIYKVSAGRGAELGDYEEWDKIPVPDTPEARKSDFCLTISGNSMEPIYHNRDIVLVKAQDYVDLGQIGIFTIENNGYIKKFGGDRLISLNDEYDDILFSDYTSDDIHCNGLVIGRV